MKIRFVKIRAFKNTKGGGFFRTHSTTYFAARSGQIDKLKRAFLQFNANVYQMKGGGYEV